MIDKSNKNISQSFRFLFVILYLLLLFLFNWLAFGNILPSSDYKGFWFLSGAVSLILGSLLFNPFFTTPADAISYLLSVIVGIHALELLHKGALYEIPRLVLLIICYIILVISCMQIIFKDANRKFFKNLSEISRIIANSLGNPRFIYTLVIFYSLWEYHNNFTEIFWISSAAIFIITRPLEKLYVLITVLISKWNHSTDPKIIGTLWAYQHPNIFLLRQDNSLLLKIPSYLIFREKDGTKKIGISIGYSGKDEEKILRIFEIQCQNTEFIDPLYSKIPFGKLM